MAQGKSDQSGKAAGGRPNRPARPSSAAKAGTGKATGSRGKSTSRPAGRGQRPPARRGKSIVNQKQRPWGAIISVIVVVVFAAAIVGVVIATHKSSSDHSAASGPSQQIIPSTPTGTLTTQPTVEQVKNTSGIEGVLAWDTGTSPSQADPNPPALQRNHVTGPVRYSITPPVGGPHNAIWMNAGVYTKPVPSERAVHNLEHGAIWITYRPNLAASEVAELRTFVGKQSFIDESQSSGIAGQANRYMDLSPWASDSLPAPIVMSSWGFQLRLQSPTDPRMQKFVDMFRNSSKYSPEYGSAVDGIPVQTGGRPAYDGGTKPNPAGAQPGS